MLILKRKVGQMFSMTNKHGNRVEVTLRRVTDNTAVVRISLEDKGVENSYAKTIRLNELSKVYNGNYTSPDVYVLKLVEIFNSDKVAIGIVADSSIKILREELENCNE